MLGPFTLLKNLEARGIMLRVSPQEGLQIVADKGRMSQNDLEWIRKFHPELIEILTAKNAVKFQAVSINSIIHGNNQDILPLLPDNSVDAVISDPPYGYGFMGKKWDTSVPVETFKECLRITKPGGYGVFFSAPRQDVQLINMQNIKLAGWELDTTPLYSANADGFPKAKNIPKEIDKRVGAKGKVVGIKGAPINFPTSQGDKQPSDLTSDDPWYEGRELTIPSSEEAKRFDGAYAGCQLKPAVEVILIARKPLSEKSFTNQALSNGKGVTWLDDCRIPYVNEQPSKRDLARQQSYTSGQVPASLGDLWTGSRLGRFPANLLVSDDILNIGESRFSRFFSLDAWEQKRLPFLIVSKATKKEKEFGLEELTHKKVNDGRQTPIDNPFQRGETLRKNTNPCVKSIKLMAYLVTMFSRPGDIVLDPFSGTGSTCIAAKLLGRNYIGIEQSEEYQRIAEARLKAATDDNKYLQKLVADAQKADDTIQEQEADHPGPMPHNFTNEPELLHLNTEGVSR
jgi:hypothetical protein